MQQDMAPVVVPDSVSALRNAINNYINRTEDSYENSNSGR